MAQLNQVETTQKQIVNTIMERMATFEQQLKAATTTSSRCTTIEQLADEFQSFKQSVGSMLDAMHLQICQLHQSVDRIEAHQRRKALLIYGISEDHDSSLSAVLQVINNSLGLTNITENSISACHRLGKSKDKSRPILVWFHQQKLKHDVWMKKSSLKGTQISISEFLTKPRELMFTTARKHFGIKQCWTQDGIIIVKLPNGERRKVTVMEDLNLLMTSFPSAKAVSTSLGHCHQPAAANTPQVASNNMPATNISKVKGIRKRAPSRQR